MTTTIPRRVVAPRHRRLIMIGSGLAVGVTAALWLVASREDLEFRRPNDTAAKVEASAGLTTIHSGDPRIAWTDLPTSSVSPLVSDGKTVWLSVMEALDEQRGPVSVVYSFRPDTGLERVGEFDGNAHATALGEGYVVFAGDRKVHLLTQGEISTATLGAIGEIVPGDNNLISAVAIHDGNLYVGLSNSPEMFILDLKTLREVARVTLDPGLSPPAQLQATPDGSILLTTPFQVGDRAPHSSLLDPSTRAIRRLDTPAPHGLAVSRDGSVYGLPSDSQDSLRTLSGPSRVLKKPRACYCIG